MNLPDTRVTLLNRLRDPADTTAWMEFCTIYERAIYQTALKRGLQDADAREVSQEVLLTVSRRVHTFDPSRKEPFRAWLGTIARNATIDHLRKATRQPEVLSDEVVCSKKDENSVFDLAAKQEIFTWAARQVQQSVTDVTWQAFWLTSAKSVPAAEVARQLSMTVGNVYVARCRVLSKIRELANQYRREAE